MPEGKQIRPLTYWRRPDGSTGWEWKHFPGQRPLYGLDRLARMPGTTVHIVEGEKACDAAQKLFPQEPCITWPGGTNAVDKTEWSPLSSRHVLIWPDVDDPGRKAAETVARSCATAGAIEVRIVQTPPSFPEKWDLADPLPLDAPIDMLDKLRAGASAYELPEPSGQQSEPETRATRPRLKAVDIESFLSLEIPPRQMVLAPILPTQGLIMIFAKRGVGKTYLGLNIAYAIACGGEFLRWHAPEPRRVLYIDGEMSGADMQHRIAEVVQGSPKEPQSADSFRIITPDLQSEGVPNLSTAEGQDAVDEHLDGVSVVVLDNLSTLCRSGRENDAESWEPVQQWILGLRRRGISVVLIHHAGKGGMQRGTSKREDVLDTIICLNRPEDYRPEEGARFEVQFEKARGIVGDGARGFEARMETRDGAATWTVRDIEDVEADTVRRLTDEGLTAREIEAETGMSKSKVNRIQKHIRAEALADLSPARYQD
jgi:putative DNA primase/helicase